MRMNRRSTRDGYAMVLVVLFLVMFLGLWGLAGRQIGSMLRIEEARARRVRRDVERLAAGEALAKAVTALEVGYPPTSSYICRVQGTDGSLFAVTFEQDPQQPDEWGLSISPTSETTLPPLDPAQFAVTPPVPPS